MLKRFIILFFLSTPVVTHAGSESVMVSKTVAFYNDTLSLRFINNSQLFTQKWDTLPQVRFWQNVISLPADSVIINIAATREQLHSISAEEWHCQADSEKEAYRQYLRQAYNLDEHEVIYVTSGKRDFYEYKSTITSIGKAADVFVKEGVDPWYAQTILLIESPGKNKIRSSAGALGPFQLMRSVAVKYGLKITKYSDERTSLEKSAGAAARLLKKSCIPYLRDFLTTRQIPFEESQLWFRLLVMHIYHAGWGNVSCMLDQLNPQAGGVELFRKIWSSECRGFKNESQNYSQIALASIILFEKILQQDGDTVFLVQGDRKLADLKRPLSDKVREHRLLLECTEAYKNDLLDGSIPFDYFFTKMNKLQKELALIEMSNQSIHNESKSAQVIPLNNDEAVILGNQLIRKRRTEDAVRILKMNIERYPYSVAAYDSLGKAYKILGKTELAAKYFNKSEEIREGKLLID